MKVEQLLNRVSREVSREASWWYSGHVHDGTYPWFGISQRGSNLDRQIFPLTYMEMPVPGTLFILRYKFQNRIQIDARVIEHLPLACEISRSCNVKRWYILLRLWVGKICRFGRLNGESLTSVCCTHLRPTGFILYNFIINYNTGNDYSDAISTPS